jgi:hypothetical protein
MKRLIWLALVVFAVTASALSVTAPASADGIEVLTSSAQNSFPNGLQFQVYTVSNSDITNVRLRYRIIPDGVTTFVKAQCNTGTQVNCSLTVGNVGGTYIVPGAEVIYAWEIEDAGGQMFTSPDQSVTYEDKRFTWQQISSGNLTVNFYQGTADSNQTVLTTSRDTIDRMSKLLNTQIDFQVKVWVYASASDMQPAIASRRGQGPNTSISTLGEVSASDTALVSRDTDFINLVRHELTHIVTERATRDHAAGIPVWVNEGLSIYAQSALLPDESVALDLAIKRDAVLPINGLSVSARGTAGVVSLFYGQSGSIIGYMIKTYGEEKFAAFVAGMKSDTLDGSLKKTYNLDVLGLENEWRQSVGLKPVTISATPSANSNERALPTLVPFGSNPSAPVTTATPADDSSTADATSDDSGGASSLLPIVGGIAVVVVLAGGAAFYLMRRKGSTPAG